MIVEKLRMIAEKLKLIDRTLRLIAEKLRLIAEKLRKITEKLRMITEKLRLIAEKLIMIAEKMRMITEKMRMKVKKLRTNAEKLRITAEVFSKKSIFKSAVAQSSKLQFFPFEVLQEEAVKYNFDGARIVCFNTKKDKKYVLKTGQNFNEAERIQNYLQSHVSNFPMLF